MNVILLEPVANVGDLGDEVTVKPGFARNYLVPKGKAVRATRDNRAEFASRREELELAANERLGAAKVRAEGLEGHALNIMVKAGEEGKLYGSVGTQDIVDALAADKLEVQKSEVDMPEGIIRSVGEFEVSLILHSEVTVTIQVNVVEE